MMAERNKPGECVTVPYENIKPLRLAHLCALKFDIRCDLHLRTTTAAAATHKREAFLRSKIISCTPNTLMTLASSLAAKRASAPKISVRSIGCRVGPLDASKSPVWLMTFQREGRSVLVGGSSRILRVFGIKDMMFLRTNSSTGPVLAG